MIIAVDTETTGFDSFNGDKPFAISMCNMKEETSYIVIGEDDLVEVDLLLSSSNVEKVGHNLKFDMHMLKVYGMELGGHLHDTMIAAFINNTDEKNYKLKDLATKYLGVDNEEEVAVQDYMHSHKIQSYAEVPRDIMEPYARKDAYITMELFKFFRKKGVTSDPVYLAEMRLLKCLVAMERRGVLVDRAFCGASSRKCKERIEKIQGIIEKDHKGINTRSSKQLADYLFHDQGIRCDYLTDKGNPAFDEFHLSKYEHPIVPLIIELRELEKIKNTYLDPLQEKADKNDAIHCSFLQTGARTGRFSCSNPNLQNIPRSSNIDVRRAFVCRPEYSLYYFDYSQIELRVLAHYSREPIMVDEYNSSNPDLHSRTCEAVFGEVTKQKRNLSKNINFGIIFGMGPKKFCEMVNEQYPDFAMSYTQAREYINNYYKTYQKVRTFTWRVPQKILDVGFVTDVFGRKYTTPRNESFKGVNYLIQGCAAGIIKRAMIEIYTLLKDKKSNLLLTIHDELVIEVHDTEEELVAQIKEIMEDRETFRVPILVNIEKTSTTWAEKL